ncbi:MAG: DUF4352 domain-containing protein, partial [Candidatus Eremiobacteraeota bacterium]|nr:DUF4352 domain-containing protein [Candidatus Eremiobacteraeota bacterium]
ATALKAEIDYDTNTGIMKVDGKPLQCKLLIKGGAIFVPVEAVVNAIGGTMRISGKRGIIRINTKKISPEPKPTTLPTPVFLPTPSPVQTPVKPSPHVPVPFPATTMTPVPIPAGRDKIFTPVSAENSAFRVLVTNVETVSMIKDYYRPRPNYKFIIVYVQQQNISNEVQIYTGRFTLLDRRRNSYDYIEGLSNFWLIILRPGGINFGYIVFEIPESSQVGSLILHTINQAPLEVRLRQ